MATKIYKVTRKKGMTDSKGREIAFGEYIELSDEAAKAFSDMIEETDGEPSVTEDEVENNETSSGPETEETQEPSFDDSSESGSDDNKEETPEIVKVGSRYKVGNKSFTSKVKAQAHIDEQAFI